MRGSFPTAAAFLAILNPAMRCHAKARRRKDGESVHHRAMADRLTPDLSLFFAPLRLCATSFRPIGGFGIRCAHLRNLRFPIP